MKALIKSKRRPGLSLENVDMPTISENDVLVKIHTVGICGTDLHIVNWDPWARKNVIPPTIIGHEFFGEIAEIGKNIKHLHVGDRVSGEGHISCGICRNCREGKQHLCPETKGIGIHRNGAFAEYLSIPGDNIIPLPDNIPNDVAAILDPLGNAVHTALTFDIAGEDVLITGAGPIGLMSVAVAKHIGAKNIVITDVNDYRLRLAKRFGATEAINVKHQSFNKQIEKLDLPNGFSVGFEMSGSKEGFHLLLDALHYSGSLALLGIPKGTTNIDCHKIIFKGLTLKGIYGRKMYATWDKTINLLGSGLDITPIITHRFKIRDFNTAFETLFSGKAAKVLLHW